MLRCVIDTNVIVSGIIIPQGYPYQIIKMWENEKFVFVTSTEIIDEVIRVLQYPKIKKNYKLSDLDIQNVEVSLGLDTMLVSGKLKVDKIKEDPEYNKFLSCASEGNAYYIITGDRHLLKLKSYQDIQITTPKKFIIEYQRNIQK